jgi:putative hydrolase of the HAD superfamily
VTPLGIAFDWGGVFTIGTFDARANARLAKLFGVESTALWPHYLAVMADFEVGRFALSDFRATLTERAERELGATGTNVREVESAFEHAFLDAPLERPEMYQLLAGIPAGFTVGMLSNNVPILCDRVRDDARTNRIEHFVFSNEIGVRKPERAAFDALSSKMQTPPERTLFIDDHPRNIAAAAELGFKALLIDTPAGFAARWRDALPELAELVAGDAWRSEQRADTPH